MIEYQSCDDAIIAVVESLANVFRHKTHHDGYPRYGDSGARQGQNPDLQAGFDRDNHGGSLMNVMKMELTQTNSKDVESVSKIHTES